MSESYPSVPAHPSFPELEREVVAIGRADAEDGALVGGNSRFVEGLRDVVAVIAGRRRAKP